MPGPVLSSENALGEALQITLKLWGNIGRRAPMFPELPATRLLSNI